MTPEDKAKELFDKFRVFLGEDNGGEANYLDDLDVKAQALICVDEILSLHTYKSVMDDWDNKMLDYWQEVKEAINKI